MLSKSYKFPVFILFLVLNSGCTNNVNQEADKKAVIINGGPCLAGCSKETKEESVYFEKYLYQ